MKKTVVMISFIVVAVTLTACADVLEETNTAAEILEEPPITQTSENTTISEEHTMATSNEPNLKSNFSSVIISDLENENGTINVQNAAPWFPFELGYIGTQTFDYNGNEVDAQNIVIKFTDFDKEEGVPDGAGYPGMRIGEQSWSNYSLSFDFFMSKSEVISFAMYHETNITEAPDFFGGEQFYWFELKNNGRLAYSTSFGHGWHWITKIDGFDPNVWNHIEVKPVNNELILYCNGVDYRAICELKGGEHGVVAIGGSVCSMFRNICTFASPDQSTT